MPQPPNMQQMMKQVQKMQQDMLEAQEALKHETVEASAGGGMVKVVVSGDLEVKSITIAPDAIDPDDPELLQDMVLAAVNEGLRSAQEVAANKMGGLTGGLDLGGLGLPGFLLFAPPIQRLVTELGKLPGVGARTAQRLAFHILRAQPDDANALADAIREVKEKIGFC